VRKAIMKAMIRLLFRSEAFREELDRVISSGFEHRNNLGPDVG